MLLYAITLSLSNHGGICFVIYIYISYIDLNSILVVYGSLTKKTKNIGFVGIHLDP